MLKQKRLLAGVLAAVTTMSMSGLPAVAPAMPMTASIIASAVETTITWDLDETSGTLTINGSGLMEDYEDASAAPWFASKDSIRNIQVNNGVTSIGSNAFRGYNNLETISLPDTLTKIGDYAFYQINAETDAAASLNITRTEDDIAITYSVLSGKNLTSIGDYAFAGANLETEYAFGETATPLASIGAYAFADTDYLTRPDSDDISALYPKLTSIGSHAFYNSQFLREMQRLDPVVIINNILVDGTACTDNEVIIPETVTTVADGAFENTSIRSCTFPDSVTSIGDNCFKGNTSLEELSVPDGVTMRDTFEGTPWLKQQQSSADPTIFGDSLISVNQYNDDYVIPTNITWISPCAFQNCKLKSLTIDGKDFSVPYNGSIRKLYLNLSDDDTVISDIFDAEQKTPADMKTFNSNLSEIHLNYTDTNHVDQILKLYSIFTANNMNTRLFLDNSAAENLFYYDGYANSVADEMDENSVLLELSAKAAEGRMYDMMSQIGNAVTSKKELKLYGEPTLQTKQLVHDLNEAATMFAEMVDQTWNYSFALYTADDQFIDTSDPSAETTTEEDPTEPDTTEQDTTESTQPTETTDPSEPVSETTEPSSEDTDPTEPGQITTENNSPDVNADGSINAVDASLVLMYAAYHGSGGELPWNDWIKEHRTDETTPIKSGDINQDGATNAVDASLILMFAAYHGSGGELPWDEWINNH